MNIFSLDNELNRDNISEVTILEQLVKSKLAALVCEII